MIKLLDARPEKVPDPALILSLGIPRDKAWPGDVIFMKASAVDELKRTVQKDDAHRVSILYTRPRVYDAEMVDGSPRYTLALGTHVPNYAEADGDDIAAVYQRGEAWKKAHELG